MSPEDGEEEGPRPPDTYGEDDSPFVPQGRPTLLHRTVPVLAHVGTYRAPTLGRDALAGLTAAALAGVVVVGVLEGIVVAVVLSVVDVVRRSARPHDAVLGWVPRMGRYANVSLHPGAQVVPGVLIYRLDDRLFFANASYVKARIREAIAGAPSPVTWFVFDAEGLTGIDSTGAEALESIVENLTRQDISFAVARLKAPVRLHFDGAGLTEAIGADHFYETVRAAVDALAPDRSPDT